MDGEPWGRNSKLSRPEDSPDTRLLLNSWIGGESRGPECGETGCEVFGREEGGAISVAPSNVCPPGSYRSMATVCWYRSFTRLFKNVYTSIRRALPRHQTKSTAAGYSPVKT